MKTQDMIFEYITGSINEADERKFFSALAYDDELRREFRAQNAIHNAMKSSPASFTVPENVTAGIFGAAGLKRINAAGSFKTSAFFSKSLFIGLASFTGAFVLGLLIYPVIFSAEKYNDSLKMISENSILSNESFEQKFNPVKENFLSVNMNENLEKEINNQTKSSDQNKNSKKQGTKYNNRQFKINDDDINESFHRKKKAEKALLNSASSFKETDENKNMYFTPKKRVFSGLKINPAYENSIENIFRNEEKPLGLELEFKGNMVWNFPSAKISPSEYSPLHNLSLSLLYEVNNALKIGAEAKQETFYLEYTGLETIEDENILFEYRQQPNFTSFGVFARYLPSDFHNIKPFAQLGISFNKGGYVFKPAAGISYKAYHGLLIIFGFDYNFFRFNHNDKWFNANKFNINYGLSYQF